MRAFRLLLLLLAAPAAAFWLGAKADCRKVAAPPAIDGRPEDWTLSPDDETEGVAYGFARDDKYLYVALVPHTREAKDQLGGIYQQDVMFWLDPAGGKARLAGLKLLAPAELGETARALEYVRLSTSSAQGAEPAAAVGPLENRGAVEARLPLSWLGTPLPKYFSFGLEALAARRPPPSPPPRSARDSHEAPSGPRFEPVALWVRVKL